MSSQPTHSHVSRTTVTGQQLYDVLKQTGFGVHNEEAGQYARMSWPTGITGQVSVVVPLSDPAEHNHQHSLSRILVDLAMAAAAGRAAAQVLDALYPGQEQ